MTPEQLSDSRWLVGLHKGRSEDETLFAVLCLGRLLSDYDAFAADAQRDYDGMREFQAKFIAADHRVRGLEAEVIDLTQIIAQWQKNCTGMHGSQMPCGLSAGHTVETGAKHPNCRNDLGICKWRCQEKCRLRETLDDIKAKLIPPVGTKGDAA